MAVAAGPATQPDAAHEAFAGEWRAAMEAEGPDSTRTLCLTKSEHVSAPPTMRAEALICLAVIELLDRRSEAAVASHVQTQKIDPRTRYLW
ncbi:hypothetical protein ACFL6C_11510 [Myxococcota bacterium]